MKFKIEIKEDNLTGERYLYVLLSINDDKHYNCATYIPTDQEKLIEVINQAVNACLAEYEGEK